MRLRLGGGAFGYIEEAVNLSALHGGAGFVDIGIASHDGCLLKSVQVTYQLA